MLNRTAAASLLTLAVATICLAQSDVAWVYQYDGTGHWADEPLAAFVDDTGNLYIVGWTFGATTGQDVLLLKLDTMGNQAWVRTYNRSGNGDDEATGALRDSSGNIYIAAAMDDSVQSKLGLLKYNPNGNLEWARSYDEANWALGAIRGIGVDDSLNVYICGAVELTPSTTAVRIVKYRPNGTQAGVIGCTLTGSRLCQGRFHVLGNGEVYLALSVEHPTRGQVWFMVKLSPQGQTRWERFYKDTDNFWHRLVWSQIDTRANLYVTGDADSSGSIDFCTMKMDSSGNTIWVREYNSPDNLRDEPLYVVPDNLGNVYVAGWSVYEERGEYKAATLVKYDSLGVQLWASRYGSGDTTCELGYGYYSDPDGVSPPPAFCPLTVGDSGTAYLTGDVLSRSESRPAFVVKYDSVGSRVWLKRRYSSQGNACSGAIVQLDKRGGMFFIGAVPSLSDDNWDLYVVKYRGR